VAVKRKIKKKHSYILLSTWFWFWQSNVSYCYYYNFYTPGSKNPRVKDKR